MKFSFTILFLLSIGKLFSQVDSTIDPLQSMVLSLCNKVESENRLAGNMNPDSAASLPFGIVKEIGVTRYIIAIDSAKFKTNSAVFSAYMAMDFPGSTDKICFSAQNISFNPKGVMPGPNTKLVLVSEHRISIGPKITLVLKPDGFNYVEWDCNGFSSVNLKGYFEFDPGMIYPDPDYPHPDSCIRANFQIHTNDIHNFVVQTSIAPFCIRGINDMSFTVLDATADFSELSNAPNMAFPQGYNLSNCNGDPLRWNGFFMRQFRVKLPRELSKNGLRPEILATNLLIDNSGVSGLFQAINIFSCGQGTMSGWGFSVNSIGANFTSNHLNGGTISGYIKLPLSETDSIGYSASIFQNLQTHQTDYNFTVNPATDLNAQILSAKLTLLNTSQLTISKVNGKFKPIAILNGTISLTHGDVKTKGLAFQQLTIAAEAPLLRAGIFSLTPSHPDSSKVGGINFSFTSIQVGVINNKPAISFGIGINFMEPGSIDISVTGGFNVVTKTSTVNDPACPNSTKQKWEFDYLQVNNVGVAFNNGPFHLNGNIMFKNNDATYGKGFYGQLAMSIEKIMPTPALSSVWFGKVNGYRYFYVDAAVPVVIPLTGCSIYRFMGGIYYHMRRPGNVALQDQLYTSAFGNASGYIPDNTIALGIKAGVTLGTSGSPKPCNGDIALEINFNSSGGINLLQLSGNVFFMAGISERQNKSPSQMPATASLVMQYDFVNDAFHAVMGAQIHLPGLSGNGTALMHFDANTWYVYIGRPQSRINVNVLGVATFTAYFEAGNEIDPMPAPPQNVTSIVNTNGLNNQRNQNALENGGGVAFGASFGTGFNGQVGFDNWYVYYNFATGAGFDIMVLDYGPTAHCSNGTDVIGINGWYATGQAYAYLQGSVGIHGHVSSQNFDVTIVTLSAAAILQTRLPNPSWVGGAMGCDYDILGGLVAGHCDFSFELGNQCSITQN